MASYAVTWTENGEPRRVIAQNVRTEAEAAWFTALEYVDDPINAKLVSIELDS